MSQPRATPSGVQATVRTGLPARYLTPGDIAEIFGVPIETVYQWRRKRTGPPGFRVGKHLRYDPAEVGAYVDQLKTVDRVAA